MIPIYLDAAASAPLSSAAADAMRPWLQNSAGNPASTHHAGRQARRALEDAREMVAQLLDAGPDEVVFTSGATEANNLALLHHHGHIIASPIEHPCVAEPLAHLAARGATLDTLAVDGVGRVRPESLPPLLRPDTRLVAVMLVNHETGAIQPVRELVQQTPAVAFHCDAAQAVGKVPVSFRELGVSTLTVSGHKFGGPVGVGVLLVRRGVSLSPLFHGGHQQQGRRPGTESVVLAVGLAAALRDAVTHRAERVEHVGRLRGRLLTSFGACEPFAVNGPEDGVPHIVNVSFPGCRSDALLIGLDLAGVACSAGSACSSGSLQVSPVLRAMGLPPERLGSAIRFSLHHGLTEADIEEAGRRIAAVVRRVRASG